MIVRFDFEDGHQPVANIHDPRIFPRTLHHMSPARRQSLQMNAARLIRAMLAPHHAEDSKLGEIGIAPKDFLDACVFVRGKAVLCRKLRRHLNLSLNHVGFLCVLCVSAVRRYVCSLRISVDNHRSDAMVYALF